MKEKIEKLEKKFVEMSEKHKFTVYKVWRNDPGAPGVDGKPVKVCEFCKPLDGMEVPYTEKWQHPTIKSKATGKYYVVEPGESCHKGCRCFYNVVIK